MNKTIKVEGNALVRRKPDRMNLAFTYRFQKERYEEVLQLFETSYSRFLESMERAGVPAEKIKTSHFSVHPRYEQEYDGKLYREVFQGFEISTVLNLRLPLSFPNLSEIFSFLSESGETPQVGLTFSLEDEKEVMQEAMKEAVLDAKKKAETIAETLGLTIGHVISVEEVSESYGSYSKVEGSPRLLKAMDLSMTPEDAEANRKVLLTVEIL
ncbi:SIMPL domain-containing protein [Proteiniclasticum ruminis]|uniref:Uncharacterized conserved protein YggE, contains kinase-interacting SIMPL domain n=1 Tax=Proteiniclasticum ruminis TaxID=398199 RepID=A0A1I5EWQ1_9CLOT|nr:SIMPL domain-containing protein [Proteiniclasticum ruminis]SFO15958.1 Uncharacterized conserved protein YggE, contains kinase-interacting SIMPL domain [Proteiniclasticum ruminis]